MRVGSLRGNGEACRPEQCPREQSQQRGLQQQDGEVAPVGAKDRQIAADQDGELVAVEGRPPARTRRLAAPTLRRGDPRGGSLLGEEWEDVRVVPTPEVL